MHRFLQGIGFQSNVSRRGFSNDCEMGRIQREYLFIEWCLRVIPDWTVGRSIMQEEFNPWRPPPSSKNSSKARKPTSTKMASAISSATASPIDPIDEPDHP